MKLIKEGRKQTGWAKEFACTGEGNGGGGCGAVLLVEQGDLFQTIRCSMGEEEYFTTFECSQCHVLTDLPDREYHGNIPSQREWQQRQSELASLCTD